MTVNHILNTSITFVECVLIHKNVNFTLTILKNRVPQSPIPNQKFKLQTYFSIPFQKIAHSTIEFSKKF